MNVEERFNELAKDVEAGDGPGRGREELVEHRPLLIRAEFFVENDPHIEEDKYDDECNSDGNANVLRKLVLEISKYKVVF